MIQYKKDNSGATNKTRDEGEQAHMAKKNVNQAIESEKDAVLWHDRKRVLGMPLSFTVYEVTDDRFILRKGFFRTETG